MAYEYKNAPSFKKWLEFEQAAGRTHDVTNGFARPEGMSDADYDAVLKLYNAYLLNESDKATKDAAISKVNDLRNSANQQEYIAYEKLKKYLPTQLKAQGLDGLGVSETALLQAYNNHSQNLGTIRSDYDTKVSDLENAYGKAVSDRNATASADAKTAYDTKIAADKKAAMEDFNTRFANSAKTKNGGLTLARWNELKNFLDGKSEVLGDDTYNTLLDKLGDKPREEVMLKYYTWSKDASPIQGKNFTVDDGEGNEYKVQIARLISSEEDKNNLIKDKTLKDGQVFTGIIDNVENLYIKIGENIYEIEGRFWNKSGYEDLRNWFGL